MFGRRGKWEVVVPDWDTELMAIAIGNKGSTDDVFDALLGKAELIRVDKWFCTLCSEFYELNPKDGHKMMSMLDGRFYCLACMSIMECDQECTYDDPLRGH